MGKFVKNLEGVVHSVVDAFKLPRGWEEVSEAEASPALLGHDDDAAVTAVALHDNARKPVADSPSVGTIGHVDTRDLDIHPPVEPAPAANADTGAAAQSTDTTPGVSA